MSPGIILRVALNILPFQTALLAYDTILTLPLEVKHIFRKKLRVGAVLYLFARYPAFVSGFPILPPSIEVRDYM